MSCLFNRKGIYYIAYFDHKGIRRKISTGQRDLELARGEQTKLDARYGHRRMKLSAFIEYYKANRPAELSPATEHKNLDALKRLQTIIGDKQIRSLRRADFEQFKRERLHPAHADRSPHNADGTPHMRGIKPVSINSELRAMHSAFNYVVALETILDRNPMQNVSPFPDEGEEASHLTVADIASLMKQTQKTGWLHDIVSIGILTGLRPGEILALEPGNIDLQTATITVHKTNGFRPKKGKVRRVPMHPAAAAIIRRRMHAPGRLFPYSISYVSHQVKKAMVDAGLKQCNFRSLRHTFATLLLQQGVPIHNVQRLLGHSSIALTARIYSHHESGQMSDSINSFPSLEGISNEESRHGQDRT